MRTTVLGYADRLSGAAGETLVFRVSLLGGARYRAGLVRLLAPDTGPQGPGLTEERVATPLDGEHEGFAQVTDSGSYAVVEGVPALAGFTLSARIMPTRTGKGLQVILGSWDEAAGAGFALVLDEGGAPALLRGDGTGGRELVSTGRS